MRFFRITVKTDVNPFRQKDDKKSDQTALRTKINQVSADMLEENYDTIGCIFFSNTKPLSLSACIKSETYSPKTFALSILERSEIVYSGLSIKEISMETFFLDIQNAYSQDLILDEDTIVFRLELDLFYYNRRRSFYKDKVSDDEKTLKKISEDAKKNHLGQGYQEELQRILKGKKLTKFMGHPAHYIIVSNNGEHRRMMIRDLITALYKKGRLPSLRYTIVDIGGDISISNLEEIYKVNAGATVLLKINRFDKREDIFRNSSLNIEEICNVVKTHCAKTLTIFSIDSCSDKIKNTIQNAVIGVSIVDISEDSYSGEKALTLLREFAKEDGVELTDDIIDKIKNCERNYDFNALYGVYTKWRHEFLGSNVFPEYKKFITHEIDKQEEKASDAYNELQAMIGLKEAKKIVDKAINYFSMQKEYRLRGLEFHRPCMHMVFTGSPGTAKTSVARLVARILKDKGILSCGKLFEVGRSELVGKYVGWTAQIVKSFFEKAKGSVLFIDEAYSLCDGVNGSFGEEAINTIVQEMENNREEVVVIFAGYQDEMSEFLHKNPGLQSRIAFHVHFDDYNEHELLDITRLLAKKTGFTINSDAESKILDIFADAKKDKAFGNGRFARNLIENAKISQSNRLICQDMQFLSDEEITTLKAEDFDYHTEQKTINKLGFGS